MALKAGGRLIVGLAVVGVVIGGIMFSRDRGYFNLKPSVESSIPSTAGLPSNTTQVSATPVSVSQVSLAPASSDYTAKLLTIPWNGTSGLMYANGDSTTANGSLMAKRGVRVAIERQDDYSQMLAQQVAFAKSVAGGNNRPTDGAAFVIIMGDGYPAYVAGAQEALGKLGQQIEVVGAIGYSRGEDKCMLPATVKRDPQKARGSLIGAVLRDGDWNICVKWASDNGIAVNPDEKTYDPNAMNFVAVNAFTEADEKLITGYCETRVVKGKSEKLKVCQNGTATWTPGDVKVVTECNKPGRNCAGITSIASTREYLWQMPTIIIGNKQWNSQNREFVQNMLAAAWEGGEQVRNNDVALTRASEVVAKVFKEETPAYWKKYFVGENFTDSQGNVTPLGGSTTIGLADNAYLFGLNGNQNLFKSVYTVFGNIAVKFYPDVMPKLIPYDTVVNVSYIQGVASGAKSMGTADKPTFTNTAQVTGTFAARNYAIEFETGKATFTPTATRTLNELVDQVSISGLLVQIEGHTDSIGDPGSNLELSKRRADSVKQFLMTNAGSSFPPERVRTRGFGDSSPVADNRTNEGRAKNRRVEVKLQTTN